MKKITFVLALVMAVLFSSCTEHQLKSAMDSLKDANGTTKALSTSEVISGLKEALSQGISKGSASASRTDGFFKNVAIKIPFPKDVQKVETRLRQIGLGSEVDKFVLSLNRAAEEATKSSKPIFVDAIKQMTVNDAMGILKGDKDAATNYLSKTTRSKLFSTFKPKVEAALNKVGCTKHFSTIVTKYNKIPTVQKVNPDLKTYATNKAIDGLFFLIKKEEANIRANPAARATELLKKVFAQQ